MFNVLFFVHKSRRESLNSSSLPLSKYTENDKKDHYLCQFV